jgi:hypothetical protein
MSSIAFSRGRSAKRRARSAWRGQRRAIAISRSGPTRSTGRAAHYAARTSVVWNLLIRVGDVGTVESTDRTNIAALGGEAAFCRLQAHRRIGDATRVARCRASRHSMVIKSEFCVM